MTKILFIVTQSEFGGAQRYIFDTSLYLANEGYEVLVAAGEKDGELSAKLKTQNSKPQLKTQNLKYLKRIPGPISVFLSIREIYKLLKKEKPDVLFLNSTTAGILGSIAGRLYKKSRVIYRIGGWAFRDPRPAWQNKIIIWLEKWTARFKDKIIVNCEIDRQLAIKYKIGTEGAALNKVKGPVEERDSSPSAQNDNSRLPEIVKIYNGVDVNKLQFLLKEKAREYLFSLLTSDVNIGCQHRMSPIVGTVANFYRTKGLKYLIEATHILNSGFKIIIIGEGRLRTKLESLIKKYNLENTVFLVGRIPNAYKYLKAFDVFVLPSLKEGFPWVILEAMAAEVPIVATKVGAVPEIIENTKEGLLVEVKNSPKLAEKIASVLGHPDKARQMASLARKKLEQQFTLQKMVEATKKVFNPRD